MVSNVPHVAASFAGAPEGPPQIFMIDSGAGGADLIFHARAVEELGLERLLPPAWGLFRTSHQPTLNLLLPLPCGASV
jgi:hypothetical protein